jgi:hypothetical protein
MKSIRLHGWRMVMHLWRCVYGMRMVGLMYRYRACTWKTRSCLLFWCRSWFDLELNDLIWNRMKFKI